MAHALRTARAADRVLRKAPANRGPAPLHEPRAPVVALPSGHSPARAAAATRRARAARAARARTRDREREGQAPPARDIGRAREPGAPAREDTRALAVDRRASKARNRSQRRRHEAAPEA